MKADFCIALFLASLAAAACSSQSHAEQVEVGEHPIAQDASAAVDLTLVLVDADGRDVTDKALLGKMPKQLYVWRAGDRMGTDSREATFGVPLRIEAGASGRRIVQLAPLAEDSWLQHGWGIAGDPAPALVLEADATGTRRLEVQVAPKRSIRLVPKLPEDVTTGSDLRANVYLAPAVGQCRSIDFQRQVDVPVGTYDLWAIARAGEWPYAELWAHETVRVQDREGVQSFVVNYQRGVQVEGRIVDMRPVPASDQNRVIGWSVEIFGLTTSALANRSFGPPFHQHRQLCELWNFTPDRITGGFNVGGLPPETELTFMQKPLKLTVPAGGGNVGEIVIREE